MELRQLRYFVKVVEQGGFGRAARSSLGDARFEDLRDIDMERR